MSTRRAPAPRARALAVAAVVLAGLAVRVLGCSASKCETDGTCCCGPSGSTSVICTVQGPACASGFSLLRGDACKSQCGGVADAQPDAPSDVAAETAADAPSDVSADAASCDTVSACCCKDNLSEQALCSDAGVAVCNAGYGLYRGDDCRCLADRQTPCCPLHPLADAGSDG